MRISELRARLADYFPDPDTYARDIIHSELGGISVNGAIEIQRRAPHSTRRSVLPLSLLISRQTTTSKSGSIHPTFGIANEMNN